MKTGFTVLLTLILSGIFLSADVPVREEQLIYSILAFNGKDYSGTFCGEDSETIYLSADTDNFMSVRKTFVYFWPITGELRTDTKALNVPFSGTLVLKKRGRESETIPMSVYTYYNIKGEYELNWMVAVDIDAMNIFGKYQNDIAVYSRDLEKYQYLKAVYDEIANDLAIKIAGLREAGKDITTLYESFQNLSIPEEPVIPQEYVVPPITPQLGFLLNLPEGEYSIAFHNEDGTVMEESDKTLVVFSKRRDQSAGLEVIPGDKWTRSVDSRTPSSVLYVDGSTDLYLRPYFQNEYNDLYYGKMIRNDARGNPDIMRWIQIQQIPSAKIKIFNAEDGDTVIAEELFYIEQTQGASLGYIVVPFEPYGKHLGLEPSLKAFRLSSDSIDSNLKLQIMDKYGVPVPGGERQVRIITPSKWINLLLIFALLPLPIMVVVLIKRRQKYR